MIYSLRMANEPTSREILEAIQLFSNKVDEEFKDIRQEMAHMRAEMATKDELAKVRAEMATKDFVDRRIASAVEEIAPTMRKIDQKDSALIEKLAKREVISEKESGDINALSPFPAVS